MMAIAEPLFSNQVTPPACLQKENPHRLVNLWDMLRQYAFGFYEILVRMQQLRRFAEAFADSRSTSDQMYRDDLSGILADMRKECKILRFADTSDQISFVE